MGAKNQQPNCPQSVGEKKKAGEKKITVARPNFVVVELIFAIHMKTLAIVGWVIHVNYSHHYATGEKGGTKREKREKKIGIIRKT